MRTATIALAAIALFGAGVPALASPQSSGGMRITANVPEVCNIAADDFVLNESGRVTGTVQEFCNSSTGYQIFASHRPLDISEMATVRYGTQTTALDFSGMSSVAFRSGQRFEFVPVEINAQDLDAPLAVAFTLSPV